MADNLTIKDGNAVSKVTATKDIGGVHYPKGIPHDAAGNAIDSANSDAGSSARGMVVRPVVPSDVIVTGPSAQSVVNTDLISGVVSGWYDASAFRSACIQIIASAGIASGQITFEHTNDSSLASAGATLPVAEPATVGNTQLIGAQTIAASTARIFTFPILARYVRCRISTAFSGGTVQAVVAFSNQPYATTALQVMQPTAANFNATLGAGANLAGDVGMQLRANATGAATIKHIVAAASTNAQNVKASAGRLVGWFLANTTASWKYVKLHNTAGTPTAGAAVVMTIGIPPNGVASWAHDVGIGFATGIGLSIVTGAADSDATAVAANDVVGDLLYA